MSDADGRSFQLNKLDLLLAAMMVIVAAWVRFRAVQLVPTFTDEVDDVMFALRIARGGFLPAVSFDTYNGPLLHYLLALGMLLGGGPAWPRLLSLSLGALTVGATYFLGVSVAASRTSTAPATARLAGLISAALMAVSFVPVVVNSHVAWSNATTPFWTTLALLALSEAHRRAKPALLMAAGFLSGLALQTHPTSAIILVGGWIWAMMLHRGWLRTRWPWLALVALLVTTANLIVYNILTLGGSLALARQRAYAYSPSLSPSQYAVNVAGFLRLAYQLVSSTFLSTLSPPAGAAAMRSPVVVGYAVIALAALAVSVWRAGLPLACWLAAFVLLPGINRAYDSHISARYMAPLLPPLAAAMGGLLATFVEGGLVDARGSALPAKARGWGVTILALAVVVLLVDYPLRRINDYYFYELRDGRNNARLWQLAEGLRTTPSHSDTVLLDRGLRDLKLDAGGHVYKALGMLLTLEHTGYTNPRPEDVAKAPVGACLVLTDATRDSLQSMLHLEPITLDQAPARAAPDGYWVYRVLP